jgi:hypothetical protein
MTTLSRLIEYPTGRVGRGRNRASTSNALGCVAVAFPSCHASPPLEGGASLPQKNGSDRKYPSNLAHMMMGNRARGGGHCSAIRKIHWTLSLRAEGRKLSRDTALGNP